MVERLADQPVDLLEINISCPNVKEGGIAFGQNARAAEEITAAVKKHAGQPVIMKLSPNVTDIGRWPGGSGRRCGRHFPYNTLTGMKIDVNRRTFALANKTGACQVRPSTP